MLGFLVLQIPHNTFLGTQRYFLSILQSGPIFSSWIYILWSWASLFVNIESWASLVTMVFENTACVYGGLSSYIFGFWTYLLISLHIWLLNVPVKNVEFRFCLCSHVPHRFYMFILWVCRFVLECFKLGGILMVYGIKFENLEEPKITIFKWP